MADLDIASSESSNAFVVNKQRKKTLVQERVAKRAKELGVVLVKLKDLPNANEQGSILTDRQREWVQTSSYNSSTHNPVLYKYAHEATKISKEEVEQAEARAAVQGLSDNPVPQPPSGIAEKIKSKRKASHMQLVKQLEEELTSTCLTLEARVKEASDIANAKLAENIEVIEQLFTAVSKNETLQTLSMEDLLDLWRQVINQFSLREVMVKELDASFHEVEEDRVNTVKDILSDYAVQLKQVAYMLPEQLDHLVEGEGMTINMSILANKRHYINLSSHILTASSVLEKEQRKRWEILVKDWRELVHKNTLDDFKRFMETKMVYHPDEEVLKESLLLEQSQLERKREELMESITKLKPPKASTDQIYGWSEAMDKLYKQLNVVHSDYLLNMQHSLESTQKECEEKMESLRKHLMTSGAFDSSTSYELMMKEFLPLVDQYSCMIREKINALEKSFDSVLSTQKQQFTEFFQFIQGTALLWTSHESAIEQARRQFTENLEKVRNMHDGVNQNLEANLDVVLDRLRQCATQETLKQYMHEAMIMLATIKEGYFTFRIAMMEKASSFPATIRASLDTYEASLCKVLGVEKRVGTATTSPRMSMIHSQLGISKRKESVTTGSNSKKAKVTTVMTSSAIKNSRTIKTHQDTVYKLILDADRVDRGGGRGGGGGEKGEGKGGGEEGGGDGEKVGGKGEGRLGSSGSKWKDGDKGGGEGGRGSSGEKGKGGDKGGEGERGSIGRKGKGGSKGGEGERGSIGRKGKGGGKGGDGEHDSSGSKGKGGDKGGGGGEKKGKLVKRKSLISKEGGTFMTQDEGTLC